MMYNRGKVSAPFAVGTLKDSLLDLRSRNYTNVQSFICRVENAKANRQDLMIKLEKISDASLTAEERAAMMDKALLDEEENLHLLDQELKRLRDLQYKKAQELFEGKTMEKNTMAEIQGSRAASRNLSSRINKLDHDSLKQQEIIYNQVTV